MYRIKYVYSLIVLVFLTFSANAKTIITMERDNGIYKVPCLVNGAKMKFVFDTGASAVSLSTNIAEYLLENNYISQSDLLGVGKSQTADGRIVDHLRINLREIEIGGVKLRNVEAIVLATQNAPLLLGQSAIRKLGKFELEGNKLILYNFDTELSDAEIEYYANIGDKAMEDGNYEEAINNYRILYGAGALSNYGISELARAYDNIGEYNASIQLYRSLIGTEMAKASSYNPITAQFNLFVNLAHAYLNNNQSDFAKIFIEKGVDLINDCDFKHYPKLNLNLIKEVIYSCFAASLWNKELFSDAADYYYKAIDYFGKAKASNFSEMWNICVSNSANCLENDEFMQLLDMASNYVYCLYYAYRWNENETSSAMKLIARKGGKKARIFCNSNNILF